MNTNYPTVELFFVFAFTYCKIRVYETEVGFARKLLEAADVEFFESTNEHCQEVDARLLISLMIKVFPKMLEMVIPEKSIVIEKVLENFSVRKEV